MGLIKSLKDLMPIRLKQGLKEYTTGLTTGLEIEAYRGMALHIIANYKDSPAFPVMAQYTPAKVLLWSSDKYEKLIKCGELPPKTVDLQKWLRYKGVSTAGSHPLNMMGGFAKGSGCLLYAVLGGCLLGTGWLGCNNLNLTNRQLYKSFEQQSEKLVPKPPESRPALDTSIENMKRTYKAMGIPDSEIEAQTERLKKSAGASEPLAPPRAPESRPGLDASIENMRRTYKAMGIPDSEIEAQTGRLRDSAGAKK